MPDRAWLGWWCPHFLLCFGFGRISWRCTSWQAIITSLKTLPPPQTLPCLRRWRMTWWSLRAAQGLAAAGRSSQSGHACSLGVGSLSGIFVCGDLISALYPLFLMKSYCERATERNKEKMKRKKHPQIKVKENRMKQIRNPTEQKLICWNMLRMEALDAPFNGHCWKIVILWRANSFCDKCLFGNFFMLKSMFCCWFCFVHDKKIYIF